MNDAMFFFIIRGGAGGGGIVSQITRKENQLPFTVAGRK